MIRFLVSIFFLVGCFFSFSAQAREIQLSSTKKVVLPSGLAGINITLKGLRALPKDSIQELKAMRKKLEARLKEEGIILGKDSRLEVRFYPIEIRSNWGYKGYGSYRGRKITGYYAIQEVLFAFKDVRLLEKISQALARAEIASYKTIYTSQKQEQAKKKLRLLVLKDLRKQAQEIMAVFNEKVMKLKWLGNETIVTRKVRKVGKFGHGEVISITRKATIFLGEK